MLIPKRGNTQVFKFERDIVEFKNSDLLDKMPLGLQYLIAKEITRVDLERSKKIKYDYLRMIKQGQEIVIDIIQAQGVQDSNTLILYNYYYINIEEILETDKIQGNYFNTTKRQYLKPIDMFTFNPRKKLITSHRVAN